MKRLCGNCFFQLAGHCTVEIPLLPKYVKADLVEAVKTCNRKCPTGSGCPSWRSERPLRSLTMVQSVIKPILWASVAVASFTFLGIQSVEKMAELKAEQSLAVVQRQTPEIERRASEKAALVVKRMFAPKIRDNENRILQAEIKAVSASAKAQDAKAIASQALSVGQDAHFKAGVAIDRTTANSKKITREIRNLTGD